MEGAGWGCSGFGEGAWGCLAVQGVGDPGPTRSAPRESADKVVLHTGKYEELIVCSHEIAASTAQLVAASKVRLLGLPGRETAGQWCTRWARP